MTVIMSIIAVALIVPNYWKLQHHYEIGLMSDKNFAECFKSYIKKALQNARPFD